MQRLEKKRETLLEMRLKKFFISVSLLSLIAFAIPIEHKYDKLFRFFSLDLIPEGLVLPKGYDKKIYFYPSDLIALVLTGMALFWIRVPFRDFFSGKNRSALWILFFCAAVSIALSPLSLYPLPYIRLWQLLTPILLFSFITTAFSPEERDRAIGWIFKAFVAAALFQTVVAITQYFLQESLGLRLLGELRFDLNNQTPCFYMEENRRWIFDRIFERSSTYSSLIRAIGTLYHPNVLGGFLATSILLTYSFSRGLWLIPIQFFAMCITYSRSALFGWVLGTGVWFGFQMVKRGVAPFFSEKKNWHLIGIIVFSVVLSSFLLHEQFSSRGGVVNYNHVARGSDSVRIQQQNIALKMIQKHPLFGVGFTQYSLRSPAFFDSHLHPDIAQTGAHNIFLFLGTETGLISLAAFLFFIASLLVGAFFMEATPITASLFAAFASILFIGLCDFYPILSQQGKLMFFLLAGFLASHRKLEALPSRDESYKMFDRISSTYDPINRILSFGMDQRWRKEVARHLPVGNLKILDLATGTGDQLLALFKYCPRIESAVGIDLSSEMLSVAREKFAPLEIRKKVDFQKADAQALPFANGQFDAATFSFGIRNVSDPSRSLREIFRTLKPRGKCLILEFSLPPKIIRPFYFLYLRHLLPLIGGLLSRKFSAYRYLNQTIETFPSGIAFSTLMENVGFTRIQRVPFSWGAVTLYVGEKE